MSRAARRRTADVAVVAATTAPLARPSGRFDALVDMGNPMKGINLFPYLRRRVEGRALGAIGPTTVLELSRTVREAAMPRRWPREVCLHIFLSVAAYAASLTTPSLTGTPRGPDPDGSEGGSERDARARWRRRWRQRLPGVQVTFSVTADIVFVVF